MSVNKDVENMYRKDAEKQRKNQKKKKNNNLITLIIIILIIAGILFLLNYLGIGIGFGKGGDGGNDVPDRGVAAETSAPSDEAKAVTETVTEASEAETVEYVDITVAGSAFIYNNNVTELEAFLETVDKMNDKVVVRIADDNATQNAMEDLKKALDEKGRNYIIDDTGAAEAETEQ